MTKKVKLAIVLLSTVAGINGYAQKKTATKPVKPKTENIETKATREETMDWIGGKMKENLGSYKEFISYSAGKFVFKRPYGNDYCDVTIDLSKVTGMSNEYSDDFYITGKNLFSGDCTNKKKYDGQELSISGPNFNGYNPPFNFTPDQPLVDRLRKAFKTLIEYNSKQKGADEKF